MPAIITGEPTQSRADFVGVEHKYDYPEGLNLDPKSELHQKIKSKIHQRALEAGAVMSKRFPSWNEIDRVLTTYIDLDDKEIAVKAKDSRKPVSIVFPYSYAILETILGYLTMAFFQEPMFRYEGVSPEDIIGSIMLEKVIDLQCNKTKVALSLHTMFRDSLAYGIGVGVPSWYEHYGSKTVKQESGILGSITGLFKPSGYDRVVEEDVLLFEGNKLNNIDPYLCLPDPNVSVHNVQDGEFFGWVERTNYMDLLSEEKYSDDLFNVRYVHSVHNKQTSIFGSDKSERMKKIGGRPLRTSATTNPVDLVNMYVKLIPREWKIGTGEYPEKWFFTLAADDVIIRAKPLDLDHNMFPVAIAAPDFDGYSITPVSRMEKLYGLQGTLDWLFNAHIRNVRKALNDMFVYDPYLINTNDLKNPGAGKLIRLRRPAWGRGVKDAVQQLEVNDVTRGNIADSSWIVEWMQKIGGAGDTQMGSLRKGGPERLTKAEFGGTQKGAYSRLERIARIIGLQSMQDIGYMFASHTQQLMSEERYLNYTGRWQQVLMNEYGVDPAKDKGRMKVTPFDILVDYDMKVRDGSIPGDNYSEVWMRMFDALGKYPELAKEFDIVRIFKHIARNAGSKNVDEFVRIKVLPDQQVAQEVQQGNLVPFGGTA